MSRPATALIADDEPLLREALERQLAQIWPELRVVAQARNGREAIAAFDQHRPDICFLDVQMPGVSGVEAARAIGGRAHLVFVTAFEQYAVEAFARGALDYLVKPVERERLQDTVDRLQERLRAAQPPPAAIDELIAQLAARLTNSARDTRLHWIRAGVGQTTRLVAVEDVDFLRSDEKYTIVGWHGERAPAEALVRLSLKELAAQLDPAQFVQVHRSVIVNLRSVSHVTRGPNETATIHLKGRPETLPVSRPYVNLFRQM